MQGDPVQVVVQQNPIVKAVIDNLWMDFNVCKIASLACPQSVESESRWVFLDECFLWKSGSLGAKLKSTSTHLHSIDSLRKEGIYCYNTKCWRRIYVTRDGISIHLLEDVPESGGQRCMWAAGLVMTKYLEFDNDMRYFFQSHPKVLELGAGSGLTSMIMSLLGGIVLATEQSSCIDYLQRNIDLNSDIENISVQSVNWNENNLSYAAYDLIIGCDITYDAKLFEDIFASCSKYLSKTGMIILCHDDDSCPLSKYCHERLIQAAKAYRFHLSIVPLQGKVPSEFYSETIHLWKITYLN